MAKPKKKKKSPAEMHRNLQDSLQALPYAVAQMEKEGKRTRAFFLKHVQSRIMRLMKSVFDRTRYKGTEGAQLKQKEQMARHMEMRRKQLEFMQNQMRQQQQRQTKRGGKPR